LVLDDDDREALEAEDTYIEIRTFEHPFGVVRGQILNIGKPRHGPRLLCDAT
jgi:hypothetical protein